jgi:TRAP-type C4-dicarboxylate transport system substrate-binding protein
MTSIAKEKFKEKFSDLYATLNAEKLSQFTAVHTFTLPDERVVYDANFWNSLSASEQAQFKEIQDEYNNTL